MHGLRRVVHQERREALNADAGIAEARIALHVFHALFDPARQILAHVIQHPDFAEAAIEQRPLQIVGAAFAGRQEALQHQVGARAFDQLIGPGVIRERMQNEWRQVQFLHWR